MPLRLIEVMDPKSSRDTDHLDASADPFPTSENNAVDASLFR